MDYQVTLLCKTKQYKPISTIVKNVEGLTDKEIRKKGIMKILMQKGWTMKDLTNYGYVQYMAREYNPQAIAKANAERYERIKQEKYACGEWKAPKKKEKIK